MKRCSILTVALVSSLCWAGPDDPVLFPDPNLQAAVQARLGVTNPTEQDLLGLTGLPAAHRGIVNLTGLEYASNLSDLELSANGIGDISPLAGLAELKVLRLDNNQIRDITALTGLTRLERLLLHDNQIADIQPLRGLNHLRVLDLAGNHISDLPDLSDLAGIQAVNLASNHISHVGALASLSALVHLDLAGNQIGDIGPLVGLSHLAELNVEGNPLDEAAYCAHVPAIQEHCPGVNVQIDPFAGVLDCDAWSAEPEMQAFKLLGSDGQAGTFFGYSVSLSGEWAIVGAPYSNDRGKSSGSAFVFRQRDGAWLEHTKLVAPDGQAGDDFGISVAIDDEWAFVGAWYNDEGGDNAGAAYVFHRVEDKWIPHAKLQASDRKADGWFGHAVAVCGDRAIVGQYKDDANGVLSGSAHVFECVGDVWLEQAKLLPSDAQAGEWFGYSVSLAGDWAIIGAPAVKAADRPGSAYLFRLVGDTWMEHARLSASDGQDQDQFGYCVSMTEDWAAVGAPGDDDRGDMAGSTYLFKWEADAWKEHTKLSPSSSHAKDSLGAAVSVCGDWCIVGAPRQWNEPDNLGSAYLFKRNGDVWRESIHLPRPGDPYGVEFGLSVAVSNDEAIAGVCRDGQLGANAGAACVFAPLGAVGPALSDANDVEGPVLFVDPRLQAAVELRLGVRNPTASDMLSLTDLTAEDRDITNLTGLECAINLTSLELPGNEIADIATIHGLINLRMLDLSSNRIGNIDALHALVGLEQLNLDNNQIDNITTLAALTNLKELCLGHNRISEIGALEGLTRLERLYLQGNQVHDISALRGPRHVEWLYLNGNEISDISVLADLTNLQWLYLYDNHVSDITPLGEIHSLRLLNILQNPLSEASCDEILPHIMANNPGVDVRYSCTDWASQPQASVTSADDI
jgi:Leucine-rich repeat (LRR) protein